MHLIASYAHPTRATALFIINSVAYKPLCSLQSAPVFRSISSESTVIKFYGRPDALACGDVPEPVLGPRDVLVDVRAASVIPIDIRVR